MGSRAIYPCLGRLWPGHASPEQRNISYRRIALDDGKAENVVCQSWRARECRSEEHTSELKSLMRISYAVFCLKKKKQSKLHNSKHLRIYSCLPNISNHNLYITNS